MNKRQSVIIVLVYAANVIASPLICAAEDENKIKQFLQLAPVGLKKWEEREKTGSSVVRMTTKSEKQGSTTYEKVSYFTIFRSNPMIRIDSSGKDQNVSSVIIAGKDYGARLARNPDSSNFETKWLGTQSEVLDNLLQITQGLGGSMAPRCLFGIPVAKIIRHPDFNVMKIKTFNRNGKELWKVHFDRITQDKSVGSMYDSWILFDPNSDWAVLEAQYHFDKDKSVIRNIRNEYVKGPDGLDRIKSAYHTTYSSKSESTGHDDFDILEYDPTTPPDLRFDMTNLGLPSLKKTIEQPEGTSARTWLFAGAFILFGIAFGINRASRQNV
jgi:hypothetical protein